MPTSRTEERTAESVAAVGSAFAVEMLEDSHATSDFMPSICGWYSDRGGAS